MPREIIKAMVVIKKAAARVNARMNGLEAEMAGAIEKASDEVRLKIGKIM